MITDTSAVVATSEQVSCDLNGEATILCLKNGKYYGLSEVGSRIWELLAERRSVSELHGFLMSEYEVSDHQCRKDLLDILNKLAAEGLVEVVSERM